MRLTRARVINYKSIDDSGWVNLEDVTALVGKNESGKTAFLQALRKLRSISGEDDHFPDALRYYVIGRHGVGEQPDIAAMNLMQDGTGAHHGVGYGRDDHSMGDF